MRQSVKAFCRQASQFQVGPCLNACEYRCQNCPPLLHRDPAVLQLELLPSDKEAAAQILMPGAARLLPNEHPATMGRYYNQNQHV